MNLRSIFCGFALLGTSVGALNGDAGELPEVVAQAGAVAIKRSSLKLTANPRDPHYRRQVQEQVNWHYQLILLSQLLKVEPNPEIARKYVNLRLLQCEKSQRPALKKQLKKLVLRRDFQLKAALQLQFLAEEPQKMRVTDAEIVQFYQANQRRFVRSGQADFAVMKVGKSDAAGREKLKKIQARLLQGEAFEQVAREIDPGNPRQVAPPEVAVKIRLGLNSMRPGEYRAFAAPDGNLFLVRLKRKTAPEVMSLNQATPIIREELAAQKLQHTLQEHLQKAAQRTPLHCYF